MLRMLLKASILLSLTLHKSISGKLRYLKAKLGYLHHVANLLACANVWPPVPTQVEKEVLSMTRQ